MSSKTLWTTWLRRASLDGRLRAGRRVRLAIDELEHRLTPSVTVSVTSALTLTGDAANDSIKILVADAGASVEIIDLNGNPILGSGFTATTPSDVKAPIAGLSSIAFLGNDGADTLTYDNSGGFFAQFGISSISFDGGATNNGSGDKLLLQGSGAVATATYAFTGAGAGTATLAAVSGTDTINFSNLDGDASMSSLAVTDVVMSYPSATAKTLVLRQATDPTKTRFEAIAAAGGFAAPTIDLANPSGSLTVLAAGNAGTVADVVNLMGLGTGYNAALKIANNASATPATAGAGLTISEEAPLALASNANLTYFAAAITLRPGATIALSGSGAATLTASGLTYLDLGAGISVQDGNLTINSSGSVVVNGAAVTTSGTGNISLLNILDYANNSSAGSSWGGVALINGATVKSTSTGASAGTIWLQGSTSTSNVSGVYLSDSGTVLSSANGDITVNSKSSASAKGYGFVVSNGAQIVSTGSGATAANITLNGWATVGASSSQNYGMYIGYAKGSTQGGYVTTYDGNINITARAGGGGSGVFEMNTDGSSIIQSTHNGNINITGIGGVGTGGILIGNVGNTQIISSGSGNINIVTQAASGGLSPQGANAVLSTGTGNINLIQNANIGYNSTNTVINAGTNAVTIAPYTANNAIALSTYTAQANLNPIVAGTVQVGLSSTGALPGGISPTRTIASITESSTTATIVTTAPHGFAFNQTVTLTGVSVAGYNATYLITGIIDAKTFTVTATAGLGNANDGSAAAFVSVGGSGNITVGGSLTIPSAANYALATTGNIAFSAGQTINAPGADVTLTTGTAGSVTAGDNVTTEIIAKNLTINAGSGGIGSVSNNLRVYANSTTNNTSGTVNEFNLNPTGAAPSVQFSGNQTITGATNLTGNVVLHADSTSSYEQIAVSASGSLNLNSATLNLSAAFLANPGDVLTIVKNNGGTVTGTFNGLIDGNSYAISGQLFTIAYTVGGDVTLTKVAAPNQLDVDGSSFSSINAALQDPSVQDGTVINVTMASIAENVNLGLTSKAVVLNFAGGTTVNTISGGGNDLIVVGGSLTLGDATKTAVAYAAVTGGGSLTKANAGTQTLAGYMNFTGGTTINAGSLQIGDGVYSGALSSLGGVSLTSSTANLTFATGATGLTYGGAIATVTSATVTKTGPGKLIFIGANAYTTATTITGGTLQIGDGVTSTTAFAGPIADNANLTFNPSSSGLTYGGALSGPGSLNVVGSNALTLSGTNSSYLGQTNVLSGTLVLGSVAALGSTAGRGVAVSTGATLTLNGLSPAIASLSGSGTVQNGSSSTNATLTVGGNGIDTTFSGLLQDGGSATLALKVSNSQGQVFTLQGPNTYSGGTSLAAFFLAVSSDASLGTAPANPTAGNIAFLSGSATIRATSSFEINANRGISTAGGTLDVVAGRTLTYGGIIAGAGAMIYTGGGSVVLYGDNTYTGGSIVGSSNGSGPTNTGGNLQLGNGGATGSLSNTGTVTIIGALTFNRSDSALVFGSPIATYINGFGSLFNLGSGSVAINNAVPNIGNVITKGTGSLVLKGTNTYTGATIVGAGTTLQVGAGAAAGSLPTGASTNPILNRGTLIFNRSDGITFAGPIVGSGGIVQGGTSSSSVTLAGTNTYTGATSILAGTLQAGSASAIGVNSAVSLTSPALLILNNNTVAVGSLSGTGIVENNGGSPAVLTVGSDNSSGSFDGVVQDGSTGSFALIKTGSGSLTLSGGNAYSGGTTLSAGKLLVTNATGFATGSGPVTVNGGVLASGAGVSGAIGGPVTINAAGILAPGTNVGSMGTLTAANTLSLSGTNAFEINAADLSHDLVTGVTTVTYGGILKVGNFGGTIVAGQSWQLISAAAQTPSTTFTNDASFNDVVNYSGGDLPTLTGGLKYHFDYTTGTLSVAAPSVAATVTAVAPFIGPTSGGNTVLITGTGFKLGATILVTGSSGVTFGGADALSYTVTSATQITAVAPSGSSTVDVVVTNNVGSSTASTADHYTYTAPAITSVVVNGAAVQTLTGATWTGGDPLISVASTAGLVVGSQLSSLGDGFPTDAFVTAVNSATTFTSSIAPASAPAGPATIRAANAPVATGTVLTLTGATWSNGGTTITGASTANLFPGQYLTASGLPAGERVVDILSGTSFTISSPATAAQLTGTTIAVANSTIAKDGYGELINLQGQQSRVENLLVTFNMKVTLDVNGDGSSQAFSIASVSGVTASVALPATANVAVTAVGVPSTGDNAGGYTQYILNFIAGGGATGFTNAANAGGNAFTLLDDGLFQLNSVGAKIHAGVSDTAANHGDKFWALYGAVNPADITVTSPITPTPSGAPSPSNKWLVDGVALSEMYAAFGSFANVAGPPAYNFPYDFNLDGIVDGIDLGKMYANFGTIWTY